MVRKRNRLPNGFLELSIRNPFSLPKRTLFSFRTESFWVSDWNSFGLLNGITSTLRMEFFRNSEWNCFGFLNEIILGLNFRMNYFRPFKPNTFGVLNGFFFVFWIWNPFGFQKRFFRLQNWFYLASERNHFGLPNKILLIFRLELFWPFEWN